MVTWIFVKNYFDFIIISLILVIIQNNFVVCKRKETKKKRLNLS